MKLKVLFVAVMIILVAGCAKDKEAITGSDFLEKAEEANYKMVDNTAAFDYAESVYSVSSKEFTMYFIDGKKSYDIKGLFLDECANIYKKMTDEYDKTTTGGDNWTTLEIKTDKKYYYVSWVKDTYLYIEAPLAKEKELEKFVDSLGY